MPQRGFPLPRNAICTLKRIVGAFLRADRVSRGRRRRRARADTALGGGTLLGHIMPGGDTVPGGDTLLDDTAPDGDTVPGGDTLLGDTAPDGDTVSGGRGRPANTAACVRRRTAARGR
nr:hypothetical protein [Microbacterium testaceum]